MVELLDSTGGNNFADWITGYPGVGAQTGFGNDPDNDRLASGLENYFGTDPAVASTGLAAGTVTGNTFTFSHPLNDTPADDISATYRWSKDLATFLDDGDTDGDGTTVDFVQGTPAGGTVTVTATITGPATARLFVDVRVTQN